MYAAFRSELSKLAAPGTNFGETLASMARQTVRAPAMKGATQKLTAPAAQSSTRLMAAKPHAGLRSTILPPSGGVSAAPTPYIPLHSNSPVHHSELANTMRPQPLGTAATLRPPMAYSA
jgi:hypothetical protein